MVWSLAWCGVVSSNKELAKGPPTITIRKSCTSIKDNNNYSVAGPRLIHLASTVHYVLAITIDKRIRQQTIF